MAEVVREPPGGREERSLKGWGRPWSARLRGGLLAPALLPKWNHSFLLLSGKNSQKSFISNSRLNRMNTKILEVGQIGHVVQ